MGRKASQNAIDFDNKDLCDRGFLLFTFCDEPTARELFNCDPRRVLSLMQEWKCHTAIARIRGQSDRHFSLLAIQMMAGATMMQRSIAVSLYFASGEALPPKAVRRAWEKSESDSGPWGIVRCRDGQQIIMSSGMAGHLLAGVSVDQTTGPEWKRQNYWEESDHRDFTGAWQQYRRIEGDRPIEFRYRIRKPGTQDPWEYYRSSFRPFDADGETFQLCEFIDRG